MSRRERGCERRSGCRCSAWRMCCGRCEGRCRSRRVSRQRLEGLCEGEGAPRAFNIKGEGLCGRQSGTVQRRSAHQRRDQDREGDRSEGDQSDGQRSAPKRGTLKAWRRARQLSLRKQPQIEQSAAKCISRLRQSAHHAAILKAAQRSGKGHQVRSALAFMDQPSVQVI
jgi:hypothetical protein